MSRPTLTAQSSAHIAAITLAATLLLHAGDPAPITAPPGYKVVYHDMGNGTKMPILVQVQSDPIAHAGFGGDPLDHQKVFSETNEMASKTYVGGGAFDPDKTSNTSDNTAFSDKVYNSTQPSSVYDVGSKPTYGTAAYNDVKSAPGSDTSFSTATADVGKSEATSAFAAIGSSGQNQTAPIADKSFPVTAAAMAEKTFQGPEEQARHRHLQIAANGQLLIDSLPDRPLTIDEVKNLINHGFKPDISQPPPPASKPLNDPNYQPEPLRIEPTEPEIPPPPTDKAQVDDDKDDPVPPPGTMAAPSEPLPSK